MLFSDALTLDAPRRTSDGYMAVRAKVARTGVYEYSGREVDPENKHGLRDTAVVHVLRDAATVFDPKAARSFIGKPVTDDHPKAAVTSQNWRDHARGTVMGAKWEEGGYLAFDLLLTDAEAIRKVDAGKRELSNGYSAELEFGDFQAADGTRCQARQTSISGNHVALVDRGRAGSECAIKDGFALCDSLPSNLIDAFTQEKPVKTMLIDGLTVDVSNADTAMATIQTLIAARDGFSAKLTTAEAQAVTDAASIVAKDAEIAKLTADLAAAKPTLQQLRDAGKAFAVIEGKAKAVGVAVTDAMDEASIMKAVVDKQMPGNTYTGDHIKIAFETLTKDVKVADQAVQPLGAPQVIGDAAAVEAKAFNDANDFNAWRTKSAA
ncbi:DUF2213 domain-containing protein [Sphingobium sp. AN558]|uniref:DUF2213 domain-containing protein n=1 Tax=Sphingobium sp. AN558 TaxID=3133442 RepID=UPI0030BB18B5